MKRLNYRGLFFILVIISACTKAKIENGIPRLTPPNMPASSIRLFNFCGLKLDIKVNNIPLTDYSTGSSTQQGLVFFPAGNWSGTAANGSPFTLPSTLLDKTGNARIVISAQPAQTAGIPQGAVPGTDTVMNNDPTQPKDYYYLSNGHFKIIPRSLAVPANPANFKIRVINYSSAADYLNLSGSVSLTYSNGTAVSTTLSGIPRDGVSGYVELPYGAYQLKAFFNNDIKKQLTLVPAIPIDTYGAPPESQPFQEAFFPVLQTFKPGATYSVVVTRNLTRFEVPGGGANYQYVNSYRIITENSAGTNLTYAQIQGVNTLTGAGTINFQVDNIKTGKAIAYGRYNDYEPVIAGSHIIKAFDANGKQIAEKSFVFSAYDAITAWIYNKGGKPDIIFTNTDMTGAEYIGNYQPGNGIPDDGTDGSIRITKTNPSWRTRFLNLSGDVPYTTFTNDNRLFSRDGFDAIATENLGQGFVPGRAPYITVGLLQTSTVPLVIRVFQSSPGPPPIVPGNLLYNITPVYASDFIANKKLYSPGYTPIIESGAFSVALIGKTGANVPVADKARLIIVKHNK